MLIIALNDLVQLGILVCAVVSVVLQARARSKSDDSKKRK